MNPIPESAEEGLCGVLLTAFGVVEAHEHHLLRLQGSLNAIVEYLEGKHTGRRFADVHAESLHTIEQQIAAAHSPTLSTIERMRQVIQENSANWTS